VVIHRCCSPRSDFRKREAEQERAWSQVDAAFPP